MMAFGIIRRTVSMPNAGLLHGSGIILCPAKRCVLDDCALSARLIMLFLELSQPSSASPYLFCRHLHLEDRLQSSDCLLIFHVLFQALVGVMEALSLCNEGLNCSDDLREVSAFEVV